jgi:MoaE-MoaD fusion protein
MQVKCLFFATLKDIVGSRQLSLDLPAGATVAELLSQLEASYPRIKDYRSVVLTAINEEYVDLRAAIADGDEVALFPPVSGGSVQADSLVISRPQEIYRITRDEIDAQRVGRDLQRDEDGAICVFEGVVRNNSKGKKTRYLEYEGYEPMALKKMEEIGIFIRQGWEIDGVGIIHRLGRMEIGETSVAIVVTSAHRKAAFEACQYAIDRLKKIVPIWKKEFFEDGEVWIEGQ